MPFISTMVAGILLIIAVLGLVFRSRIALMIARVNPFFSAKTTLTLLLILGLVFGGVGWITGFFSGFSSTPLNVATITGTGASTLPTATLESCVYQSATGITGNVTVRQDPNSNDRVYLDVDESTWIGTGRDANEVVVNFTLTRSSDDVSKEQAIKMNVEGAKGIRNEISTSDSNEYYLFTTSTRKSLVYPADYTQVVYVSGDGSEATTSDTQETAYVEFALAKKTQVLSILGNLDTTTFSKLNNYTMKDIVVSEADTGKAWCYITINKLP